MYIQISDQCPFTKKPIVSRRSRIWNYGKASVLGILASRRGAWTSYSLHRRAFLFLPPKKDISETEVCLHGEPDKNMYTCKENPRLKMLFLIQFPAKNKKTKKEARHCVSPLMSDFKRKKKTCFGPSSS